MCLVYLRTRHLLPLVVAHWSMDFFGALYTRAWSRDSPLMRALGREARS